MNGVIITIDTNDAIQVGHLQWPGALVSIASLPAGDLYAMCPDGATILIERKTPRDLLDSMQDGRLFNQIVGLVEGADFAYLLVTGEFMQTKTGVNCVVNSHITDVTGRSWHSLQGTLLSIQQLGCAILYDPDYHGAVERIINRSRDDIKVGPRRESYVFSPEENVLMALPGIGSNKAVEILKRFPSVGIALEWLTDPGIFEPKIPGIAGGTKQKIADFIGGKLEVKL
jgi:ERCC4-type nuclease